MRGLSEKQIEKHGLKPGDRLIEYSANNSGGSWWLKDKDWRALEGAGWIVPWVRDVDPDDELNRGDGDGRWLGALAMCAFYRGNDLGAAIQQWERITGQNSNDLGCSCCGVPHSFREYEVYAVTDEENEQGRKYHADYENRRRERDPNYTSRPYRERKVGLRYPEDGKSYRPDFPAQGERYNPAQGERYND